MYVFLTQELSHLTNYFYNYREWTVVLVKKYRLCYCLSRFSMGSGQKRFRALKRLAITSWILYPLELVTQQTHNVATTSLQRRCNVTTQQRRCNVTTLQRRCNDVVWMLCVCWVNAQSDQGLHHPADTRHLYSRFNVDATSWRHASSR